jgi:hypothetical protein
MPGSELGSSAKYGDSAEYKNLVRSTGSQEQRSAFMEMLEMLSCFFVDDAGVRIGAD